MPFKSAFSASNLIAHSMAFTLYLLYTTVGSATKLAHHE